MKRKRLFTVLLLAVALGFVALGVVKMRSTGADVSTQAPPQATPDTRPSESVFGPHSYELSDYWEFAPPPEDLPPPAIRREEIIARVQANLARVQSDIGPRIASVDLVTVVKSAWVDEATSPFKSRQWLVVVQNAVSSPLTGGPIPLPGSRCDVPQDQKPPSCLGGGRYRGTAVTLYDAETGELTTQEFDGEERCDIPTEGVEPC